MELLVYTYFMEYVSAGMGDSGWRYYSRKFPQSNVPPRGVSLSVGRSGLILANTK